MNLIPSNLKSNMKLQRCLILGGASGSGSGLSSVNKVIASSETKVAEKEGLELPVLKKMRGVDLKMMKKKAYV